MSPRVLPTAFSSWLPSADGNEREPFPSVAEFFAAAAQQPPLQGFVVRRKEDVGVREPKVCLVLKPGATRADFARAAADAGFAYFEERPGNGDTLAYEQVWGWPNLERPTAGVYFLESPFVSFPYIEVTGSELPLLAKKLTDRLAVYTRAELIDDAMTATEHNDQVRAINRLAVGFVDCPAAVFGILTNYILAGATPLVRECAVNAIGFHAWPEFRSLLTILAEQEKEANVRGRAAALLAAWPAR